MNAFDILLRKPDSKNQQQQSSSSRKRRTPEPQLANPSPAARTYQACPICQRSLPSHFLQLHTESCLGEPQPPPSTTSSPLQTPTPTPPASLTASSNSPHGPLHPQHPVPHLRPPSNTLSSIARADTSSAKARGQVRPPDTTQPCAAQPAPNLAPAAGGKDRAHTASLPTPAAEISASEQELDPVAASLWTQQADAEEDASGDADLDSQEGSGRAAGSAKNAFQVLMEGQRQQKPGVHVFFMERTRDGSWRWHWWQKVPRGGEGSEPPLPLPPLPDCRWSATTSMRVTCGAGASAATLQLQSNVAAGEGGAVSWADPGLLSNQRLPPEGRWRGSMQALKSALQKNIRLGRAPCAVRCAMQLLKDDPGELLRRLPIICLEDTLLHPSLPFLVWLMAAHAKGFVIGRSACSELLRVTYQMASVRVRDYLPPANMCPGRMLRSLGEADAEAPAPEAALVKALLLRAAYGGMPDDVAMLRRYAGFWVARFGGRERGAEPPPAAAAPAPEAAAWPGRGLETAEPAAASAGGAAPALGDSNGHMQQWASSLHLGGGPGCIEPDPSSSGQLPLPGAVSQYQGLLNSGPSLSPGVSPAPSQPGASRRRLSSADEAYFSLRLHGGGSGGADADSSGAPPAAPLHPLGFTPATLLLSNMAREQQALQQALQPHLVQPHPGVSSSSARPHAPHPPSRSGPAEALAVEGRHHVGAAPGLTELEPVDHPSAEAEAEAGAHGPSAAGAADGAMQCADLDCQPPPTAWLAFLHSVYVVEPPPQMVSACSVGPLRLSDVPASAIDFHVSDVVQHLLGLAPVHAAAAQLTGASWGVEGQPESCLRSAMWLFRSSLNHRRWLHALYEQQAGVQARVAYEHVRLLEDLEAERAQRERLEGVWEAAAFAADSYSRSFIRKRFQPL